MRPLLTLLLVIPLTGCAGVVIYPEDSTTTKVAKVAARVPTAPISLGPSEQMYFCARDLDHPALSGDSDAHMGWARLTPQERLSVLSMCQELGYSHDSDINDWEALEARERAMKKARKRLKEPGLSDDERSQIRRYYKKAKKNEDMSASKANKIKMKIKRVGMSTPTFNQIKMPDCVVVEKRDGGRACVVLQHAR